MPLKKEEIEQYRQELVKLRAQLTESIHETTKEVKDAEKATGYSQHQADEATDDFTQNVDLEVSTTEYETIKAIDRALAKIEEGTYGICEVSGEEISKKRLDAVPYATMTVKALEAIEKGNA